MNNEQYNFILGALARIDRKIDHLQIQKDAPKPVEIDLDEFEEEFDI
jgi:hypothetical protein